jgi:hypothetical protein
MAEFWTRKLAGPATQVPVTPGPRAWWREETTPAPAPPGYDSPRGLAVRNYRAADQAVESRIAQDGYLNSPPKWVQAQATDRCPNCDGVNFAQMSGFGESGSYGGLVTVGGRGTNQQTFAFKRCFDCGFSPYRGLSDSQVANRARLPMGAATPTRQVAEGGGVLNNFHPREIVGHV